MLEIMLVVYETLIARRGQLGEWTLLWLSRVRVVHGHALKLIIKDYLVWRNLIGTPVLKKIMSFNKRRPIGSLIFSLHEAAVGLPIFRTGQLC